ncbi:hypothetical protein TSAR_004574 [Trichomalopsis sarcophagae]|uniref:Uncharacterized protein n=1 Tax=Trichomalopsis sarcophagae TaxID=543379 RepID=A0A232F4I5_9HYME|nr:hypothetical protein TSAR_004574 [Trichomalopsis sarcophagae]
MNIIKLFQNLYRLYDSCTRTPGVSCSRGLVSGSLKFISSENFVSREQFHEPYRIPKTKQRSCGLSHSWSTRMVRRPHSRG